MKCNKFSQISTAQTLCWCPKSCVKHDTTTPGEGVRAQLCDLSQPPICTLNFTARLVFQISSLPLYFLSCLASKPKRPFIHILLPYARQMPRAIGNMGLNESNANCALFALKATTYRAYCASQLQKHQTENIYTRFVH